LKSRLQNVPGETVMTDWGVLFGLFVQPAGTVGMAIAE
jgi:hypothetical protein